MYTRLWVSAFDRAAEQYVSHSLCRELNVSVSFIHLGGVGGGVESVCSLKSLNTGSTGCPFWRKERVTLAGYYLPLVGRTNVCRTGSEQLLPILRWMMNS